MLDSYAVLAFLGGEPGSSRVASHLKEAEKSAAPLLMNEINVGETYSIIARHRSRDAAEDFLLHLETLPIEPVPNSFQETLDAARIKAGFPLSYADAFAVATAVRFDATVITGDREFEAVADLVNIDWID